MPPADNTTDNGTNLNVGAMTTLFVGLVLLGIGQTTALLPALPEMQVREMLLLLLWVVHTHVVKFSMSLDCN